jgi:hypothetical protein
MRLNSPGIGRRDRRYTTADARPALWAFRCYCGQMELERFWFYAESGQSVILSRFRLSYLKTLGDEVEEERPVNIVPVYDDVGWPGVGARGLYDVKGSRLTGSNGVALGHLCCPGNGIRG